MCERDYFILFFYSHFISFFPHLASLQHFEKRALELLGELVDELTRFLGHLERAEKGQKQGRAPLFASEAYDEHLPLVRFRHDMALETVLSRRSDKSQQTSV